mmetsp:Transcript_20026/g.43287  ORF Transcript_20026/g.43287 Transcript_20026/m.43287 type:complete len:553 (-) Transcript_20026:683-2341(-)
MGGGSRQSGSAASSRRRESSRGKAENGQKAKGSRPSSTVQRKKKKGDFLVDLSLRNDLPAPPFDPKYIKIPWNAERLFNYHISSLEQNYKYRVHLQPVVGQPIHLIDPTTAEIKEARLADADKALLRRENDEVQDFYGSNQGARVQVSTFGNTMSLRNIFDSTKIRAGKHWLRKTEYIGNNQLGNIHNYTSEALENKKRLAHLEKSKKQFELNSKNLTKSERIEESFKQAKSIPKHQTKPGLKPVKMYSLLPSLKLAENTYFHVSFLDENLLEDQQEQTKENPANTNNKKRKGPITVEYSDDQRGRLSKAVLQQIHESEASQISYLLPETSSTGVAGKKKRKVATENGEDDVEEEEEEEAEEPAEKPTGEGLKWVRDYDYNLKEVKPFEKFALLWDKKLESAKADVHNPLYGTVQFVELEPSAMEMRRKQTDKYDIIETRKKRIAIERRPFDATERETHEDRRRELEDGYYVDDMDIEVEEDNEKTLDKDPSKKSKGKSVGFADDDGNDSSENEMEFGATKPTKNGKKTGNNSSGSDSSSSSGSGSDSSDSD